MGRYRIGLFGVHSTIDYPYLLRMGVQNVLEEAGATLVPISELVPYHTLDNAEAYLSVAAEITSRLNLDAVIYPAGCVAVYLRGNSGKALELLHRTMDPAKTLVLERDVPGYRCLSKDNAPGMHDCLRHLIEDCGFTRIGFVSGPEDSRGAQEREAVYFEELAAHGIEADPRLFARGDFGGDCADVVERLLDDNPDIQAIACACDMIAYTVYKVLAKRKLAVGKDVAVTGFDDHPRSAHLDPPLSTVHMTSYDFGRLAAEEALRLCEGKPQERRLLSSRFIPRSSCGEDVRSNIEVFRELLRQKPFPTERFVDILMDSSLSMASERVAADFRQHVEVFFGKIRATYLRHRDEHDESALLFSSQDLAELFARDYHENLSLEGFHTVSITLLEALLEESPEEDAAWVVEQISHLHLRIARLLSSNERSNELDTNWREWITFHTMDDALRMSENRPKARELMLGELVKLGVREADLYLLPEPVEFIGARAFALSDTLYPVGSVVHGEVRVPERMEPTMFQDLLAQVLPRYADGATCTVGGLMAGNELLGVALMDCGTIGMHRQLMVMLNLGSALKHLQMIANEREMNEVLSRNNLLLKEQSTHDELTGLLNRRGMLSLSDRVLKSYLGRKAVIVYLDLDGLKYINDTFGHDAGDDAIRATARILEGCLPPEGKLGRLGGDEFVAFALVDEDGDPRGPWLRVQEAIAEYNATHDLPYELSISAGATVFTIEEDSVDHLAELVVQADERLYEMKRTRKGARR